jgi:arginyl-tRNA--protein-N-Asp/Glu arginylyltransferase
MARSDAQKRASNKWDAANMKVVATKIRKEDYDLFKKYAEDRGQTVSSLVAGYVRRCIAEDQASE